MLGILFYQAAVRLTSSEPSTSVGSFAMPAIGTFGNMGRNAIYSPRSPYNIDLSSSMKTTKMTERTTLEFRWELFNAFNMTTSAIRTRRSIRRHSGESTALPGRA